MNPGERPSVRVFDERSVRQAADDRLALASAERAFRALAEGAADVPPPVSAEFQRLYGEIHVKGAHIQGAENFVFKFATGFYGNVQLGVPTGSGLVLLFDAETGFPRGVLFDNGYLTDLRTAAAGALAARHLTPSRPLDVAVIGAGVQARLQARLLAAVRPIRRLRVWSRRESARHDYAQRVSQTLELAVEPQESVAAAVTGADLIITATPSREALVEEGMVAAGATVIAVGSDGPEKQELDARLVAGADKVVTDLTDQCARLGELQHPVRAGLMSAGDVWAELGQVVVGERPGREADETIVCDLTGVGAQDATMAEAVFERLRRGNGDVTL